MRVEYPNGPRPAFRTNALKAVVLSRDITLCFAGDVAVGIQAIRTFGRGLESQAPFDDLVRDLSVASSVERRPTEFILAQGGTTEQVMRIRAGHVERDLASAWIGDSRAFERFQEERLKPLHSIYDPLADAKKVSIRLTRALEAVIDDPTISSVDDFAVAVAYRPDGFVYAGSMFIHVGRDVELRNGDDLIAKMAQPVAEGGYSVCVVEPAQPGIPCLALLFPMAHLGIVYLPLQFDEGQVLRDVAPNDFVNAVRERFGVTLTQPMLTQVN